MGAALEQPLSSGKLAVNREFLREDTERKMCAILIAPHHRRLPRLLHPSAAALELPALDHCWR